jgi:hypothetical protein
LQPCSDLIQVRRELKMLCSNLGDELEQVRNDVHTQVNIVN